jgi:hypothetical protein
MHFFFQHCPSYFFFKNVVSELQSKALLTETQKFADEYLIHHCDFDMTLPSIPATLLPSIMSKLLIYIKSNEMNSFFKVTFIEMNQYLESSVNAFNFQLEQDFKDGFKKDNPNDNPFFFFQEPCLMNNIDGILVEINYSVDKFDMVASLTKVLFTVKLHIINKAANTNSFQFQILKAILVAKPLNFVHKQAEEEEENDQTKNDILPTAFPLASNDLASTTAESIQRKDYSYIRTITADNNQQQKYHEASASSTTATAKNGVNFSLKEQRLRAKEWRDNVLRFDPTTEKIDSISERMKKPVAQQRYDALEYAKRRFGLS